mmetsp:Transcript_11019/g.31645  ORF Transcript_11019/g.31645 Transcript_11019/m.31645 type:complete len:218 (+) Transcript_11019:13-666(+)
MDNGGRNDDGGINGDRRPPPVPAELPASDPPALLPGALLPPPAALAMKERRLRCNGLFMANAFSSASRMSGLCAVLDDPSFFMALYTRIFSLSEMPDRLSSSLTDDAKDWRLEMELFSLPGMVAAGGRGDTTLGLSGGLGSLPNRNPRRLLGFLLPTSNFLRSSGSIAFRLCQCWWWCCAGGVDADDVRESGQVSWIVGSSRKIRLSYVFVLIGVDD